MVEKAEAGEETLPKVLLRDVVRPAGEVRCRAGALNLLAHEVDQGDVLVGEHLPVGVPSEVVGADADQDHLAVVELVLALHVDRELAVARDELPYPTHLLPPREKHAVHVPLGALKRDEEKGARLDLLQDREDSRRPGSAVAADTRHRHERVEVGEGGRHGERQAELLELKVAGDLHTPRLGLLDVPLSQLTVLEGWNACRAENITRIRSKY